MTKKRTASEPLPLRLEYRDPEELDSNPSNWRSHPAAQTTALADAIGEVGWAGALLFNEKTQRLIDGHARKELFAGKGKVPVLVGSWSEEQERLILATLDPLAAMASANVTALDALLKDVATGSEALQEMLAVMAKDAGLYKTPPENEAASVMGDMEYRVIIRCQSEAHQAELIERFEVEGLQCQALIS